MARASRFTRRVIYDAMRQVRDFVRFSFLARVLHYASVPAEKPAESDTYMQLDGYTRSKLGWGCDGWKRKVREELNMDQARGTVELTPQAQVKTLPRVAQVHTDTMTTIAQAWQSGDITYEQAMAMVERFVPVK